MLVRLCRICKSKDLKKIFSLGKQPIANNLLDKPGKVRVYPLELLQCQHCSLIQLSYVVPKEKLYDNYLYIPSVSKTHLKHFEELSANLIKDLQLKKGDVVTLNYFNLTSEIAERNEYYYIRRKFKKSSAFFPFLEVDYYTNKIVVLKD